MPRREPSITVRCCRTSSAAPSAGVSGRLPYTRVRWPSPWRLAWASDVTAPFANTSCIGATFWSAFSSSGAVDIALPTQRLPSWATFSSSVIAASSSSTRSATGRAWSRHGSTSHLREFSGPTSSRTVVELRCTGKLLTQCDADPTLVKRDSRKLSKGVQVDSSTTSRRNFLRLAMAVPRAGSALAACGTAGPSQAGAGGGGGSAPPGGGATYWYLSGQPSEGVRTNALNRFNQANPNDQIQGTTFQNDAYKTRIRTAVGANQAPTIIWGWGGGTLRSYVQAGQVEDLTSWFGQNAAVKRRLFSSAFAPATVNGKIYAMPAETVQPIILYWNKRVFQKVGAQPPQSWGDIMNLVPKFNAAGVAPFSLGGQSRWTNIDRKSVV